LLRAEIIFCGPDQNLRQFSVGPRARFNQVFFFYSTDRPCALMGCSMGYKVSILGQNHVLLQDFKFQYFMIFL
jgi:hypothetical protein